MADPTQDTPTKADSERQESGSSESGSPTSSMRKRSASDLGSARECRARKKLRYRYLEEEIEERREGVVRLKEELKTYEGLCTQLDGGDVPLNLLEAPAGGSGLLSTSRIKTPSPNTSPSPIDDVVGHARLSSGSSSRSPAELKPDISTPSCASGVNSASDADQFASDKTHAVTP